MRFLSSIRRGLTLFAVILSLAAGPAVAEETKIPGKVAYKLEQHEKAVTTVEEYIAKTKLKRAGEALERVTEQLKETREWNKSVMAVDHPAYLALEKKLTSLQTQIDEKKAAVEKLVADLEPVIGAIDESTPALQKAVKDGRYALMALDSVESHYSQYRDEAELQKKVREADDAIAAANLLLPPANALVIQFRKQFPDEKALNNLLPRRGYDIMAAVDRLDSSLATWTKLKDKAAKRLVKDADESIRKASDSLRAKKSRDRMNAISNVQMWAIRYHGALLPAVALLYPENASNADSVLALSDEQKATAAKARSLLTDIAGLQKRIGKLKASARKAAKAKIAANRFPRGAKLGAKKAAVARALKKEFGKPLRMAVDWGWTTKREARWVGNHWDVGTFNYMGVWLAVKTPSKKHRVYRVTVRQRKQPDGSWGPVHYWSVGSSFEMLKKNIKK